MMAFWLVCGVCILIALAFVLPPLLQRGSEAATPDNTDGNLSIYKDQLDELDADLRNGIISSEQYEQDRDEINRRVLDDVSIKTGKEKPKPLVATRNTAYFVALSIPILAVGLYLKLGNQNARPAEEQEAPMAAAASGQPGERTQAQIEANVNALAKRLEANPSDLQGWKMLARSYSSMDKYDEAAKAYDKALALQPRDPDLMTNLAVSLAMANNRSFEGRPQQLIDEALKLDPENTNTLGVAGGIAFEQKDYNKAIDYWTKVVKKLPPDSDLTQAVNEKISEAKALAAGGSQK
jgi:cytochrome c-type biogenesis protein CcmH